MYNRTQMTFTMVSNSFSSLVIVLHGDREIITIVGAKCATVLVCVGASVKTDNMCETKIVNQRYVQITG